MDSSEQKAPPYTKVIDLTSRGQQQERRARAQEAMGDEGEQLPEATVAKLPDRVRKALDTIGWPSLMPVQQAAIPYLLAKQDLIAQSRTGSGKTGAFLLPLFDLLDPTEKTTQALILAPTRELARQIHDAFEQMCGPETEESLRSVCVYGGVRYAAQNKAFKRGTQVVIGTPGRILDHLERRSFSLDSLRLLILDEADEMLSMGFYPAMRQLKRYLPEQRKSYMFSATMPPKVQSLAREFLNKPGFLALSTGNESVDAIDHRFYVVPAMEKDRALVKLIEMENPDSAIIFANTKRDVEYLMRFLQNFGHDADGISGDLTQKARERVMARLRNDNLRFLVATDVAARGIDISDLSHVFMYDVPQDPEYFIHRSGRTARAGKSGTAIVIATHADKTGLLRIGKRYGVELEERELPSDDAVNERVSERMTVLLEDRMRDATKAIKKRLNRFVPLAESLAKGEPALFAMLLDKTYHDHTHAEKTDASRTSKRPDAESEKQEDSSDDAVSERVTTLLRDRMQGATNLVKERLNRFVPLAESLAEEEPELLAMLLDKMYDDHLHAPTETPASRPQPQRSRSKDNRSEKPRKKRKNRNKSRSRQRSNKPKDNPPSSD